MNGTSDHQQWRERGVVSTTASPCCRLRPVPIRAVTLEPGFWHRRLQVNRDVSIPLMLRLLEEHGVVDNFRRLAGAKGIPRRGPLFTDSDLYKWMEAAAFALQSQDSPQLRNTLSEVVETVVAAQGDDGYLNTCFVNERAGDRFRDLASAHELYCAGHLFQAAIAHHRATGETRLLSCALRFADYLCEVFGPGKLEGAPGHPEIEMALVELYRETGRRRYLNLAGFFLQQRGITTFEHIWGHAVRAVYFCCGGADYYAETGDQPILNALQRQWDDMTSGKMYITGGIGSRYESEAFGKPFELPNSRAYAETCAAVGNIFWNWRMLALDGDARFADTMERVLYNGFLAGVSLDGRAYFYTNPLAHDGKEQMNPWGGAVTRGTNRRSEWHACTCCPPNVQRMLASLPGYMASTSDEGVWVHLYDNYRLQWRLPGGIPVTIRQETRYPWEGRVRLEISPAQTAEFTLFLRIPGWCRGATVMRNGQPAPEEAIPGSYMGLRRRWSPGDEVLLDMPMPVQFIECNPRVPENRGSIALQRGPVVYCLESVDNDGVDVLDAHIYTQRANEVVIEHVPDLLGGIVRLHIPGAQPTGGDIQEPLYRPLDRNRRSSLQDVSLVAIPYYAWANRAPSAMTVWVRRLD